MTNKKKELKGFISSYDGSEMSFDDYIREVANGNEPGALPVPVLEGIKQLIQDKEETKGIRVTSLLGCMRQTYFQNKIGREYINPHSYYAMFRGTIAHTVMENFKVKGAVDEKRFSKKRKGLTITGKPDRILPKEKIIQDYKTTKQVPQFGRVYKSHEQQLNIYRWLVKDTYPIDKLEVIYIDMETSKSLNARIWSDEEVENFIDEKLKIYKQAMNKDILPEFKKIPLCDYCQYSMECKKKAYNEIMMDLARRIEDNEVITKKEMVKRMNSLTIL